MISLTILYMSLFSAENEPTDPGYDVLADSPPFMAPPFFVLPFLPFPLFGSAGSSP